MEPRQLGPYRVIRKLGEGAMGAVYEGVDAAGKSAAIKLLPSHLSGKSGFRARFEIEIETLRKLNHPNIVRIEGWELTTDGTLYYAMELVEGFNLDTRVGKPPPFTWKQVVDIGCQLCKALKHAHDRGIIHRDIKPANIMLARDGTVKLSDFGIAKLYGASGLTLEDTPIGTANYMSPEQTEGKKATERSDLYSLGCTFYALLAGRPPFLADTLFQMLKMHRTAEPIPVRQFRGDVPAELDKIILTLLAKEPENRIANAGTLYKALQMVLRSQALLHGEPIPEGTGGIGGTGGAGGTGGIGGTGGGSSTAPAPARATPPAQRPGGLRAKSTPPVKLPPLGPDPVKPAGAPAQGDLAATVDSTLSVQDGAPTVATPARTNVQLAATVLGPATAPGQAKTIPEKPAEAPAEPTLATDADPNAGTAPATFVRAAAPAAGPEDPPADDPNSTIDKLTTAASANTRAAPAEPARGYEVDDPDVTATADPSTARRPAPAPPGKAGLGPHRPAPTLARNKPAGRFVSAAEAEELERQEALREASEERRELVRASIIRTVIALVIVSVIALPTWYFFFYRPRTIEAVYARIAAASGPEARVEDLLEAQDDIADFLARAPEDPRAAKVRQLQDEVSVQRLERQVHARSFMRKALDQNVSMMERLYSDAMSHARSEPDVALAKLQAMIDLVSGAVDPATDGGKEVTLYLQLAEKQKVRLHEQFNRFVGDQLIFLRGRVEAARKIAPADPARARAICRSVVDLFGQKQWAGSVVRRAREVLATLPAEGDSPAEPAATEPASSEWPPSEPAPGAPAAATQR